MKRWIIRSFFIGLLLLFVGGWVVGHNYFWAIVYTGSNFWDIDCGDGNISLVWLQENQVGVGDYWHKGWNFRFETISRPMEAENVSEIERHYLGFGVLNDPIEKMADIPIWFPTAISAALLLLVCRKTRPKAKGRAFPVEAAAADGGHK